MKIAVIGAAGGVGRSVTAQAVSAGHTVCALVRRAEQARMLRQQGAEPLIGDLLGKWQDVLDGTQAVVWAAGAGGSGQYQAIDGDALMRLTGTLVQRGPRRLVVVSSMGVDRPQLMPPFLAAVLRIKAVSDAHVQASGLDWTIIRPGGLLDTPGTAQVQVGSSLKGGTISRDDVASVVLACLSDPQTIHQTFEVVSGSQGIPEALAGLWFRPSA